MDSVVKIWNFLKGKKTYIGAIVGLAVLALHKAGVDIPGVPVDDAEVTANIYRLLMVMFLRHGVSNGA